MGNLVYAIAGEEGFDIREEEYNKCGFQDKPEGVVNRC